MNPQRPYFIQAAQNRDLFEIITPRALTGTGGETSRLVDRSLRPLAPPGFHDEISIACNLLSLDQRGSCDPEVLSVNAASLALALSTLPWMGAVGAVRVGLVG